jgi:hypothetical protein
VTEAQEMAEIPALPAAGETTADAEAEDEDAPDA